MKIPIIIERDEDNYYIISCPLFKGCHTYGKTLENAINNMEEAISLCLEDNEANIIEFSIAFRNAKVC